MRLLIDRKDLELLLEKDREYIGNNVGIDTMIAAISFLLSVFTANYSDLLGISGIVLKTVFCIIGVVYFIKTVWDIFNMIKNKYNHKVLFEKIEGLDMIQHNHSLIVIKDSFSGIKERYLLYYDEKWDCKLFLNYKTQDRNNEDVIVDNVSADLGVDKADIKCSYVTSRIQEKYSVSHNENRIYNHCLYEVRISEFPENEKNDDFIVNKRHYYWMTLSDMQHDENIIKKNMEVVDFVKETI